MFFISVYIIQYFTRYHLKKSNNFKNLILLNIFMVFYFLNNGLIYTDFLGGTIVKNLPAYAGDTRDNLWIRKIPWNRKWQPVPLFLPGEFHEQRRLTSYSPWGLKESNTTEQRHTHIHDLCSETAAAKSHLSCPTLCDPIDGSPSGTPVPRILQARTLEWVAISFSNA